ncbi:MAG: hypothetical protein Q9223_000463 [Gallowayella weberi]
MDSASTNQFPTFHDGDVEIRLSRKPGDRLVLHSFILGLHSSFLKTSLEQRWSGNDNSVKEMIKWRYELTIDSDGLGLLSRKNSTVAEDATNDDDQQFFYQDKAIPETRSDRNLEAKMAVIEAHRRYLKANYYTPFDIPFSPADSGFDGLRQLSDLTRVGDLYDGLKTLKTLAECLILRHINILPRLLVSDAPIFLDIASKLEIGWLFKDIVCQTTGDTSRDDEQVKNDFTPSQAVLILRKRYQLRRTMDQVDLELLMIDITPGHTDNYKAAVYKFREQVIKSLMIRKKGAWKDNNRLLYNELLPSLSASSIRFGSTCAPLASSGPASAGGSNKKEVIDLMHEEVWDRVKEITAPLYWNYVSPVCITAVPGFTCSEVFDHDLPWIGK